MRFLRISTGYPQKKMKFGYTRIFIEILKEVLNMSCITSPFSNMPSKSDLLNQDLRTLAAHLRYLQTNGGSDNEIKYVVALIQMKSVKLSYEKNKTDPHARSMYIQLMENVKFMAKQYPK